MKTTEQLLEEQKNRIYECSTCGHKWKHGENGSHDCTKNMVRKDSVVSFLPEEMPLELNSKILSVVHGCECEDCHSLLTAHYKLIAYYFNNLPVDWRPVSEKPEKDSDVWLWDGISVYRGIYVSFYQRFEPQFYGTEARTNSSILTCEDCGNGCIVDDDDLYVKANTKPTHWTYAHLPEPPKE